MHNLSTQSLEAYADWLASADGLHERTACYDHAANAHATEADLYYISNRANYLRLARIYGEGTY